MEIFRLVFSPIEVNTYILSDQSGECAVIDCGCYDEDEFGRLTDHIQMKNLIPRILLNTHCHLDHIFGNGMFLEKYNIGTYCSQDDVRNLKNAVQHAQLFGLNMKKPPEPAGYLSDGDVISFGSVSLKALYVPGHSPGSLAFYSEKEGVVFTGDALFAGSIGRTDLPGGNYIKLIESIKSQLFTLPHDTIVYPGHREETTIGKEIEQNPYFQ